MRRWRPILLRICVFLLLLAGGAIVNVAVAWGCVRLGQGKPRAQSTFRDVDPTQHVRLRLHEFTPAYVVRDFESLLCADDYVGIGVRQTWFMPRDRNLGGYPHYVAIRIEGGWPLFSMEGLAGLVSTSNMASPWQMRSVSVWNLDPKGQASLSHMLPLRALWPGFAINTVFYAAILWLLFAGPFALRRWRRIKRGLCPKCAYDLRGTQANICPECGSTR